MIDQHRWDRTLLEVLSRHSDDIVGEREAVHEFGYLHASLTQRRTMPDYLRRALRSFVWSFLGTLIGSGALSSAAESGVVDWSALKKVGISAFFAGVIALITFVINLLEDTTSMPALLKAPASGGENPVPEPPKPVAKKVTGKKVTAKKQSGQVSPGVLALVLVVALIVFLCVR